MTIRDNRQLVAALLGLDGVAGASIEETDTGPGTLRLQLAAGSDQVVVAGEVNRLLRSQFGLAVDPDRVRVIDESRPTFPVPPAADPEESAPIAGPHTVLDSEPDDTVRHEPDEVRALGRPPAAVGAYARDAVGVATILTTDLRLDNGVEHPAVSLARASRLTIERVQLLSAGLGATVTVTLGLDGRSLEGEAEGAATQSALLRSVATATLRAVERVADGSARFEVEHVEVSRTGTDQTALVVITILTERSTQRLSGASVVREDARQAVIRAVLGAVNRRLDPLIGRH